MAALLRGVARSIAVGAAAAGGGSGPAPAAAAAAAAQPITALSTSSVAGAAARAAGAGAGGGGLVAGAGSVSEVLGAVAAERSGGGVAGGGGEKTILMAASLPGLLGNGLSRPAAAFAVASGGHQFQQQQQQPLLSSSAAFLAHCRLSVRPQARPVLYSSNQVSAFQNKSSESQYVVVEEPSGPPSTSYRERARESLTPPRFSEDGVLPDRDGRMGRSFNPRTSSISSGRTIDPRTRFMNKSVPTDLLQDSEVYRRSPSMPFHSSRELRSSALLDRFDDNEGSDMDVDTYKRMHEITTMGSNVPDPIMTFASTGFPPALMRELENANFSSPSAIQAMTWPIASQSRDVVAVAKTGSGKTLGYLIPAFLRIERERHGRSRNPLVLVLAPTRELANQIRDETWKFGRSSRISCTCICGGASKGPQLRDLDRGVDVIVATPGRLNDLLEMNAVNLQKVSYLVIDEADRMLDMGFEPQIRAIVEQMSPQRQTLMYTATWPHEVRRIARDLLTDPVQVNIGDSDRLSANKNITQKVEIISRYDKERRLEEILTAAGSDSKVLIFCTTKRMCEELAMVLRNKFGALAIHGDKSQRERDYVMNQFKRGRTPVLVATDVAARGLDIKDIRMVINYDFPTGVEDYVHRIGRTGRAGATGVAHTFFGYEDTKHAAQLIKVLESTGQDVLPALRQMVGRGDSRRGGNSRYGRAGGRSQPVSKWGQNDRFGGDKYGNSSRNGGGGDRYGGGNDRFGSGNDRFGNGSDRFGNRNDRPAFNNSRFGNGGFDRSSTGNERFGSGNTRSGNGSERKSFDRPGQKWGLSAPKSSVQHDLNGSMDGYGIDKSLLTPQYGELKMGPDGTMSLW